MKSFWNWIKFILVKEANPLKRSDYFGQLMSFREDIQVARRVKDWRRLCQYRCMFVLPILNIFYNLYLYSANLNEFDSHIQLDFFKWINSSELSSLVCCGFLLLSTYYLHLLYFSSDISYFMDWFKKIVVEGKRIKYHWPYHYKKKNCSDLIRKTFVRIFRCFQTATISTGNRANFFGIKLLLTTRAFLDLLLIVILAKFNKFAWNHLYYFVSSPYHFLQIIQAYLTCLAIFTSTLIMFHCFSHFATIAMVEILIYRIRIWQIDYSISAYNQMELPSIRRIMSTYRLILLQICGINPLVGKIFLAFLAVTVPASACFLILIISKDINPFYRAILAVICAHEFICIFGIHFEFARRNSQLYRVCKRILSTPFHHRMSLRTRIKVNLFTQTMFGKRRYGITYWKFGLISMMSFTKVSASSRNQSQLSLYCSLCFSLIKCWCTSTWYIKLIEFCRPILHTLVDIIFSMPQRIKHLEFLIRKRYRIAYLCSHSQW